MHLFETKNRYFDQLFDNPKLMWLGQNTNHFHSHPSVTQAMIDSIRAEEYHAYAPPAGMEELRSLIKADLGLPDPVRAGCGFRHHRSRMEVADGVRESVGRARDRDSDLRPGDRLPADGG